MPLLSNWGRLIEAFLLLLHSAETAEQWGNPKYFCMGLWEGCQALLCWRRCAGGGSITEQTCSAVQHDGAECMPIVLILVPHWITLWQACSIHSRQG